MAELLKGAPVAAAITERTAKQADALKTHGIEPTLAIVRVGERPDDLSYEKGAMKRCAASGVAVKNVVLEVDTTQEALLGRLDELNRDKTVHGILLLRPLPAPLDNEAARLAISAEKDVDGVTDGSLAGVFTGSGEGFAPCTAQAVAETLSYYGISPKGRHAVIAGRSLVVGRPAAMLLMHMGATVTICHSGTADMPAMTQSGDILVCAVGKKGFFGKEHIKEGQVVIDVGIHYNEQTGKLCGDVIFDEAEPLAAAITPVPGGVGAVTTAVLVSHVTEAALRQAKL